MISPARNPGGWAAERACNNVGRRWVAGRYAARLQGTVANGHFRQFEGLHISSIGLGTYLGEHDAQTDARYREAIVRAIELGCNLIDTAINYRYQQSERTIGRALATLLEGG